MKKCSVKMNPKVLEFGINDGPGAAAYGKKTTVGRINRMPNIRNAPAFTLKQLINVKDETESPGPIYNLERLTRRGKDEAPKFTMAKKLSEFVDLQNPGPANYKPNTKKKPKIKILLPLKEQDPRAGNPGPDVYKLPSTLSRKSNSLAKYFEEINDIDSPGPAKYNHVPMNTYKDKAPKFSLAKRFEDPLVADEYMNPAPGPWSYTPTLSNKYRSMPKFSFGIRRPDKYPPLVICGDEVLKKK